MQIFVAKDKKDTKGYIVLHNGDAFLIDPKGDYRSLKKAIGENQLKAIFLTSFEPESLSLLAAFVDIPIYIEYSNGVQLQKMKTMLNLSMLKFIYVKQVLSFKLYADLQIGLIPAVGLSKKGNLIAIFNNNYFIGDVVIDAKFSKKALKLGASSFYHKLVTIILNNQHNIIYPSKTPGFPAYKIIKDNPLTRALLPRQMLQQAAAQPQQAKAQARPKVAPQPTAAKPQQQPQRPQANAQTQQARPQAQQARPQTGAQPSQAKTDIKSQIKK